MSKAADLSYLVQGGQLYWAFPFSEDSLFITEATIKDSFSKKI